MKKRIGSFGTLGLGIAVLFASAAGAQISSPPPTLQGEAASHLFSVPGAINANGVGTFFACSNAGLANTTLGVEVFGAAGGASLNNADTSSIVVSPGATVLFGTTIAAGLSVDASLALIPNVTKGSARVLATNPRNVLCSAFIADAASAPPTSMSSLSIVKKTTQQGD
jgi:hypothetical protein